MAKRKEEENLEAELKEKIEHYENKLGAYHEKFRSAKTLDELRVFKKEQLDLLDEIDDLDKKFNGKLENALSRIRLGLTHTYMGCERKHGGLNWHI